MAIERKVGLVGLELVGLGLGSFGLGRVVFVFVKVIVDASIDCSGWDG